MWQQRCLNMVFDERNYEQLKHSEPVLPRQWMKVRRRANLFIIADIGENNNANGDEIIKIRIIT